MIDRLQGGAAPERIAGLADRTARFYIPPTVSSAEAFESAVNALQAELNAMREHGRRLLSGQD
jgi:hypothetical protein